MRRAAAVAQAESVRRGGPLIRLHNQMAQSARRRCDASAPCCGLLILLVAAAAAAVAARRRRAPWHNCSSFVRAFARLRSIVLCHLRTIPSRGSENKAKANKLARTRVSATESRNQTTGATRSFSRNRRATLASRPNLFYATISAPNLCAPCRR